MISYVILEIPDSPLTTAVCVIVLLGIVFLIHRLSKMTTKDTIDISKENIPQNKNFDILYWGEVKTPNEVLEEINKRGFRPATGEEINFNTDKIFDLEEHYPEFQKHQPIVALGSPQMAVGNSVVLNYESFSYEEDQSTGDFHFVGSHMSSLEISKTICQFAVVKK